MIKLTEIFLSIQGEGPYTGHPAVFIRLAGCNMEPICPFCFGNPPGRRKPHVTLSYGSKKPLSEVMEGDVILTFDENFNIVETKVQQKHSRIVDKWLRITIDGRQYFITPDHPFMTPHGIVKACDLQIGDDIYEVSPKEIISFKKQGDRNPMKNPEISKKSTANTNYALIGEKLSATIKRKQKEGTWPVKRVMLKQTREQLINRMKGNNNPNWKGGSLTPNWNSLKRQIKQGDDLKCSICTSKQFLEVHHIDKDQTNDDLKNLLVVCKSHHTKIHKKGYNFWNGQRRDRKQLTQALQHNGKTVQAIKEFDRDNFPPSIRPKPLQVHNLTCAPYNTYFLDNMWVHNCDTDFRYRRQASGEAIVEEVKKLAGNKVKLVVITGGEPFTQDLRDLIYFLSKDFIVQIETNGTVTPNYFASYWGLVDIIVSPKAMPVEDMMKQKAAAVKFVVKEGMKPCTSAYNCPVYVQPMDEKDPGKNKANRDWAVKLCLEHGYRLSLQVHKILDIQ